MSYLATQLTIYLKMRDLNKYMISSVYAGWSGEFLRPFTVRLGLSSGSFNPFLKDDTDCPKLLNKVGMCFALKITTASATIKRNSENPNMGAMY